MKVYDLNFYWNSMRSLLWQYDNAEKVKQLIKNEQDFYNASTQYFWNDFISNVINLDTANDFGLSLWGMLLDIQRPTYGNGIVLSTEMYRYVLKAKIFKLFNSPTIPNCNKFLSILFSRDSKRSFVQDNEDMTIDYYLDFFPTQEELVVLNLPDFLPRPSAVKIASIEQVPSVGVFGFDGSGYTGFNQGVFLPESVEENLING